jgi:cytolysin (calcineurin-like family phosphatase)
MVRLCAGYDEAVKRFDSQGSAETSRALDDARRAVLDHVRSLMETYAVVGSIAIPVVGELAYFNAWFALRGGCWR